MGWRVLGPLEVWADDSPIGLGGRQRQLILAMLLVNANETVSTDRLVDQVWGEQPPASARKTVQAHVAHLRRALNTHSEVLAPAGNGYRMTVEPEQLDSARFERAVDEARRLKESPERSVAILDDALGLFRGEPYSGLTDDALSVKIESARLSELRMDAHESRLEGQLALGDPARVAAESERLLAKSPLRERLWGIRMLALYQAGRQSEALAAYSRARQTLAEELGIEPSGELKRLEQQILDHDPALDEMRFATADRQMGEDVRRNPFKGLRAFDELDSADFFGRRELTRRLVDRLISRPPAHLTVLAGASGAGKSSVLKAGVLPELRDLGLSVAVMYPGTDPVGALRDAVRDTLGGDEGADRSQTDIVAVDQFEEVYTLAGDNRAEEFLSRIARDTTTRWVVTIRADFLDRLLAHPELGKILEQSLVLVPPLENREIEDVIVEPARRSGVEVEPALLAAMIRDVRTQASALPLLQYTLTDLFDRRRGEVLTADAYEKSGGLSGALVRRADQEYEQLDADGRTTARQVFLQMVTITEDGEFAKRRVQRDRLYRGESTTTIDHILERFGGQRLFTFDQDPEHGGATVELAHETLLVAWPRLTEWVRDARRDLQMRASLEHAISDWENARRDPSFLLGPGPLAQHQAWTSTTSLLVTDAERAFIGESAERARAQEAQKRRRRNGATAAFALIAAAATVFALFAIRNAQEAEAGALATASLSAGDTDPELAMLLGIASMERMATNDGAIALAQATQAHRAIAEFRSDDPRVWGGSGAISPDGTLILFAPIPSQRIQLFALSDPDTPLWEAEAGDGHVFAGGAFSDDGRFVVVPHQPIDALRPPRTGETGLAVFESASGEQVGLIETPDCSDAGLLSGATVDMTQSVVISVSDKGASGQCLLDSNDLFAVNLQTGDLALISDAWGYGWEGAGVPTFSLDGSRLAFAQGRAGAVIDSATGEVLLPLPQGFSSLDSTGSRVLAGTGQIELWDVDHKAKVRELGGDFQFATFSHDGTLILAGSSDGSVVVFAADTGMELFRLRGHHDAVLGLALSQDDSLLASASEDGTLRIWDLRSGMIGDAGPIDLSGMEFDTEHQFTAAAASPDNQFLATAGGPDDVISVQSKESDWAQVAMFQNHGYLSDLEFTPDSSLLLGADSNSNVVVIDTRDWVMESPLTGQQGLYIDDIDVSPDGRLVATAGQNGESWVWDLATRSVVRKWATSGVPIVAVEFIDDETLVIVPEQGEAIAVTLNPAKQLEYARALAIRSFTPGECASFNIDPCPTLEDLRNG